MRSKMALISAVLLFGLAACTTVTTSPILPSPSPLVTELPWDCGDDCATPITTTLYIPYIPYKESAQPRVFDGQGVERDAAWLAEVFGAVTWSGPGLAEIRACQGDCPTSHTVTVLDINGAPVQGQAVVWSWPDGSVTGYTDERGTVGFAMGPGAYYVPPGGGPHWVTVGGSRLSGIGMLALTAHEHINSVWIIP